MLGVYICTMQPLHPDEPWKPKAAAASLDISAGL
jgi:hypothetical protein